VNNRFEYEGECTCASDGIMKRRFGQRRTARCAWIHRDPYVDGIKGTICECMQKGDPIRCIGYKSDDGLESKVCMLGMMHGIARQGASAQSTFTDAEVSRSGSSSSSGTSRICTRRHRNIHRADRMVVMRVHYRGLEPLGKIGGWLL
jgi:hypothetical protein